MSIINSYSYYTFASIIKFYDKETKFATRYTYKLQMRKSDLRNLNEHCILTANFKYDAWKVCRQNIYTKQCAIKFHIVGCEILQFNLLVNIYPHCTLGPFEFEYHKSTKGSYPISVAPPSQT